ncbi:MAG: HIT family protein [Candidatus Izemoplasmatales bacterium]|jgi:diadenosine tetraphosphate (Ap4A) HIT family hydrolase|nr:HIT family protein [Candidatus Izemoplasmatales bacterium]
MCIFCEIYSQKKSLVHENEYVFSIYDNYPVTKGHLLIIPKRHVSDYFGLTIDEKKAIDLEITYLKDILDAKYHPDGYNIGINNGEAAGQTIFHLHVHLIPRYHGDVKDPKGGVRGVIPNKQKY